MKRETEMNEYLRKMERDGRKLEETLDVYERTLGMKLELKEGYIFKVVFSHFDGFSEEKASLELKLEESIQGPKFTCRILKRPE